MYKTIMNMINECLATYKTAATEVVAMTSTPMQSTPSMQETRRKLALLCSIPAGKLAMLESADDDLDAIGSGRGQMTVR